MTDGAAWKEPSVGTRVGNDSDLVAATVAGTALRALSRPCCGYFVASLELADHEPGPAAGPAEIEPLARLFEQRVPRSDQRM
jgi:hypothetical protein